ncbi:MAG: undecaprenyldiphospho-muramoylpentapeptide beta-N-acetylglucosaminyltransferase [Bacteroidales bacterium]|nr:undecaprenyldiphospho-muramoylpentapeptide beta-N-acetylglucosaminyltransferase [Bacteroidales bacterium]MBP5759350.1 undecaprenyldiphospho-muramoylpentapeptide beta-N-acetylglucosaminyltransferase [Bacteroidales bacterium]
MKAIISGGGTGGHIFPAVAIANAIKARYADADILFIGAEGRMEMEKVPAAGYPIKGLPIAGLQRSLSPKNIIKNLVVPFKLLKSQRMAKKIIRDFNPDIVVGVGGYASAPTLKTAAKMGYPTLLQEQNSYPGLTNKMLSAHADVICVAYNGLEKFFSAEKIVFTGNPVRKVIEDMSVTKAEGCATFQVNPDKRIILSVGGSLGARTINETLCANLKYFIDNDIQLIWQTGKGYYKQAKEAVEAAGATNNIKVCEFISQMDHAYAAADAIISRAGAISISELCLVGKPVILIPSPNVAEDHQTKNAMALVNNGAALMVRDAEAMTTLCPTLDGLVGDNEKQKAMSEAILKMGMRNAADKIVDQIEKILKK